MTNALISLIFISKAASCVHTYTEGGAMTDPLNNRPQDFPNKAIRAGVGAPPSSEVLSWNFLHSLSAPLAQERRDDFTKETVDRVMSLEIKFEGLRADALRESEQFQATFIQSVRIATTTADATKKKILQNAILNSAILSMSETIRQIFMQNLDRITPLHAVLLNFLNNPAGNPAAAASAKGMPNGSLTSVIEKTLPQIYSNKEIFDRIWSISIRWGSQPTLPTEGCKALGLT